MQESSDYPKQYTRNKTDVMTNRKNGVSERIACFTSFTFSYLAKARLLAWSLKRFHPDWHFIAVITDKPPKGMQFSEENEIFAEIFWGQELPIDDNMPTWLFKHDIVEICTAVKGPTLDLLANSGYDKIIYLDPDIAVFNSLQPVIDLLETSSIILTPHQLKPETEDRGILDNEVCSLMHGIYNLGFVAIRGSGEGARFARWWSDRLKKYCYDDIPNGLFTDQRWCDHVPVFFDGVHILKDPGYNVASWNLSNRVASIDDEGRILINGYPLRFYHVTKFGPVGETMTSRYALENTNIYEIWAWYKRKLTDFKVDFLPNRWWAFGVYDNGEKIKKKHRTVFRAREDLRNAFDNPFSVEKSSYYEWLLKEGML